MVFKLDLNENEKIPTKKRFFVRVTMLLAPEILYSKCYGYADKLHRSHCIRNLGHRLLATANYCNVHPRKNQVKLAIFIFNVLN